MMKKDKLNELLNICELLPPDFEKIQNFIDDNNFTVDEISKCGFDLLDICSGEYCNYTYYKDEEWFHWSVEPNKMYGPYLFDLLKILIKNGLNPNYCFEGMSIMKLCEYIDHPGYIGANILVQLLEAGGDPNLIADDETLFDSIDFDVVFDTVNQEIRERFDCVIHCWLVLLGYGGKLSNGNELLKLNDGFSYENFKEHEKFDVCIEWIDKNRDSKDAWIMHIFDRFSKWEVATF